MDIERITGRRAVAFAVALALSLMAVAGHAEGGSALTPYAPADPLADPARWDMAYWRSLSAADRAAFVAGYWTGLYAAKLVLNDGHVSWAAFVAWLDASTALSGAQLEDNVRKWEKGHNRYFLGGLVVPPFGYRPALGFVQ